MARNTPPEDCANCGTPIPRNALACPECGADERTGWRETSVYDGLDLPPGEDDGPAETGRRPVRVFWLVTCAGLLVLLILAALGISP